jgi:hypothetical protein
VFWFLWVLGWIWSGLKLNGMYVGKEMFQVRFSVCACGYSTVLAHVVCR